MTAVAIHITAASLEPFRAQLAAASNDYEHWSSIRNGLTDSVIGWIVHGQADDPQELAQAAESILQEEMEL